MFKPIEWSQEFESNTRCRYNHIIGTHPLGEFLISWKGWKPVPWYEIEEIPWSYPERISGEEYLSLVEAKAACAKLLEDKIKSCLQNYPTNSLTEGKMVRSKLSGSVYIITGNYGSRLTAVRSVDITNWSEWELV